MLDRLGVIYLPDIFIVQGLERKLIWCVQFLGGPSAFGIYMCNRSSSWCSGMAGISACLTGGVHLPLVSICAIHPAVGVVVWQASLLA